LVARRNKAVRHDGLRIPGDSLNGTATEMNNQAEKVPNGLRYGRDARLIR